MKKTKKTFLTSLAVSATLLSGVGATTYALMNQSHFSIQTLNSNEAKTSLPVVNTNEPSLPIRSNGAYNTQQSYNRINKAALGSYGTLVPLSKGSGYELVYLNNKTGIKEWSIPNYKGIMGLKYVKASKPFFAALTRSLDNHSKNQAALEIIDEKTGNVITSKIISSDVGSDYYLYSFIQDATDPYLFTMFPRKNLTGQRRNEYTWQMRVGANGTSIDVTSLRGKVQEEGELQGRNTYGAGFATASYKGHTYQVRMNVLDTEYRYVRFYVYKDWKFLTRITTDIEYKNIYNGSSTILDESFLARLNDQVYLDVSETNGQVILTMASFKVGSVAALVSAKYNVDINGTTTNIHEFQTGSSVTSNPHADLDFSQYAIEGDKFVLSASYASFKSESFGYTRKAIVAGSIKKIFNPSYFDWKKSGVSEDDKIKLFTTGNINAFDLTGSLSLNLMLDSNGNFSLLQNSSLMHLNAQTNGGLTYQTALNKQIPTTIQVKGYENTQLTNQMIDNLTSTLSSNGVMKQIRDSFINLREDSSFMATAIKAPKNNEFKGSVKFNLSVTNVYVNGNLQAKYTFPQTFTLVGYKEYHTKPKQETFQVPNQGDKFAWEYDDESIKAMARADIKQQLQDVPPGVNLDTVPISVANSFFGETKIATVHLPKFYNDQHELVEKQKDINFYYTGFKFNVGLLLAIVLPIGFAIIIAMVLLFLKRKSDLAKEAGHIQTMLEKDYYR